MFDLPLGYQTKDCFPNVEFAVPPTHEQLYGMMGVPKKHQGHPFLAEVDVTSEPEDPHVRPYEDLIVEIKGAIRINHTARLSGDFIKYFVQKNHHSVVKVHFLPLVTETNLPVQAIPISREEKSVVPVDYDPNEGKGKPSVWYWWEKDIDKYPPELIYTFDRVVTPDEIENLGLSCGLFRLLVQWEAWEIVNNVRKRLPISGFDDAITFQFCLKG